MTSSVTKPKSCQQSGEKEAPVLHPWVSQQTTTLPGGFSDSAAITRKVELQDDTGVFNNFLTRGFSSILGSAAIIVLLSVSLMPAHSAPAQKVDLLLWFKAPSGLAATLAQWRHCGPRLLLVIEKTKTRSNL